MNSLATKVDHALRTRLRELDDHDVIGIEIIPRQHRWRGLLRHLRSSAAQDVEYNVIDLCQISALVPKWMIEAIAERRDVALVRLSGTLR